MAENVIVKLFQNSGFDTRNIPDSPATAESANNIVTQAIFIRQAACQSIIKLRITDEEACLADYAALTKDGRVWYYFVTGYLMHNGMAEFSLELDALTTTNALNPSNNTISGSVDQRTKSQSDIASDSQALLTISDDYTPEDELVDEYYPNVCNTLEGKNNWYIAASIDLQNLDYKAKKYIDADSDDFVTVPELPKVPLSTLFSIPTMDTWKLPHEGIFDGTASGIASALNTARSLGVESAISASYVVPSAYIYSNSGTGDPYTEVTGQMETKASGATADVPGVTVENKKAMYALTKIKLMSMTSGGVQQYTVAQIGNNFDITYFANPHPDGRPYCRFKTINGNSNPLLGAVAGSNWQRQSIGYVQRSGADADRKVYNNELQDRTAGQVGRQVKSVVDLAKNSFSALATGGTNLKADVGVAKSAGDTLLNAGHSIIETNRASNAYERKQRLVAPEIDFVTSGDMQNYVGNDFAVIVSHPTPADIHKYDLYLHQFGEAVNESFSVSLAHQNSHYDYISCHNVMIDSKLPRYITNQAIAQLEGGVRVWHTLPTVAALQIGGN